MQSELKITKHAGRRMNQRGIRPAELDAVLRYGDVEVRLPGGAHSLSMSRTALDELRNEGTEAHFIERLRRVAIVIANDQGSVVTALKVYGREGRRYRREGK